MRGAMATMFVLDRHNKSKPKGGGGTVLTGAETPGPWEYLYRPLPGRVKTTTTKNEVMKIVTEYVDGVAAKPPRWDKRDPLPLFPGMKNKKSDGTVDNAEKGWIHPLEAQKLVIYAERIGGVIPADLETNRIYPYLTEYQRSPKGCFNEWCCASDCTPQFLVRTPCNLPFLPCCVAEVPSENADMGVFSRQNLADSGTVGGRGASASTGSYWSS